MAPEILMRMFSASAPSPQLSSLAESRLSPDPSFPLPLWLWSPRCVGQKGRGGASRGRGPGREGVAHG